MSKTIHVRAAERAYDVLVDHDLIRRAGALCGELLPGRRAVVVTDTNVAQLYAGALAQSLRDAGFATVQCVLPAGEANKRGENLLALWAHFADARLTRADTVFALGGGVIGDLAGFAAATYLRGVHLVQIPTSLLAQVDSSVGGKTAIDLAAGKNLAGAFYPPHLVLCDVDTLQTLPPLYLRDGTAEVIKYGMLADGALFAALEDGGMPAEAVISRCVEIKRGYVMADERDTGERQLLNLGHTPAHGIEKLSGYAVPHGHAVATGMAIMTRAAAAMGLCDSACVNRLEALLAKNGLPCRTEYTPGALAQAASMDKKRASDTIQVVLPDAIGACRLHRIRISELEGLFAKGMPTRGETP